MSSAGETLGSPRPPPLVRFPDRRLRRLRTTPSPGYDPWSRSVTEDVEFYVEVAVAFGRPGRGARGRHRPDRRADLAGGDRGRRRRPLGGDAARRAQVRGRARRRGLRRPAARRPAGSTCERAAARVFPFRSLLHMQNDDDRCRVAGGAHHLRPDGRLVFDVFAPSDEDIQATNGLWIERDPGIFERADWDETERTLTLSVRGGESASTMSLSWLSPPEWMELLERADFVLEALYGWFDRRPFRRHERGLSCLSLGRLGGGRNHRCIAASTVEPDGDRGRGLLRRGGPKGRSAVVGAREGIGTGQIATPGGARGAGHRHARLVGRGCWTCAVGALGAGVGTARPTPRGPPRPRRSSSACAS